MYYSKVKKGSELTLRDCLSRLTYEQSVRLLGEKGSRLIHVGGRYDINVDEAVYLNDDLFRLSLPDATVTVNVKAGARRRLHFECSQCDVVCEHVGAAFSLVLEEKTVLGLAQEPDLPAIESLDDEQLVQQALKDREQRARNEKMVVRSTNGGGPWSDYTVTNVLSGKTYHVALRGPNRGDSYCSCPDFRKNTLGTCKHILNALAKTKRRFSQAERERSFRPTEIAVHLLYGTEIELHVQLPRIRDKKILRLVAPLKDRAVTDLRDLLKRIERLEAAGRQVVIYPDAEEFIQVRLFQERIQRKIAEIRKSPARHPLRKELLKTELLPYQLDGIAFASGVGRAVLADDMGLGKTIQAIGVAELLAREAGISKVLVVCPATLKAQWRAEIARFSARPCQLILGSAAQRTPQYDNEAFFTVCNYEQVLRDFLAIERSQWDLIVLDEGQRIKNWEAQTTRTIKALRSQFALVLSGTPLENRLDELYSVVEFVDDRRLGPAFRFFERHRIATETGRVLGYKKLADLRQRLRPILLRRTRESVMQELPPCTTEVIRITPTEEQIELHKAQMSVISTIVRKNYLSEMDLLRLRKALLLCRMAADSTYLVDKHPPGYSTKLEKLQDLLVQLAAEKDRKIVLFSEWTTMLDLIQKVLKKCKLDFVRLDGKVPQKQRQRLVHKFSQDAACDVFITTNAGSTGLNLQAANTIINVDLPWNPAVLEQRIARAHRMGQKRPVHAFVLVSEGMIEEQLLGTLAAKHQLALAALDAGSSVDEVDLESGIDELRRRLEVLLGAVPEAPLDESEKERQRLRSEQAERRENVAAAGGQLLSAAFQFLGAMVPAGSAGEDSGRSQELAEELRGRFAECVSTDKEGRPQLTVTLPDTKALDTLAESLARLLGRGGK